MANLKYRQNGAWHEISTAVATPSDSGDVVVSPDEPVGAEVGTLWLDTDEDPTTGGGSSLTPGDEGDIVATSGGAITNVKAGRIDIRARGAVGDDATDNSSLIQSLIVEAATSGAELWVPEGTFVASLNITGNVRLAGYGTIKASSTQAITVSTANGPVSIEGITLDGNAAHPGLQSGGIIDDLTVKNGRIKNTGTRHAINIQSTNRNVRIEGMFFEADCGRGVAISHAAYVSIIKNHFDGTTDAAGGNFISLTYYDTSPAGAGEGVVIAENTGRNCARICFELWSAGAAPYLTQAPIIRDNWLDATGANMALSDVSSFGSVISGNTFVGDASYAMELGVAAKIVTGNSIVGPFNVGATIFNAGGTIFGHNFIRGAITGVQCVVNGTVADGAHNRIEDNIFEDCVERAADLGVSIGGSTQPIGGTHFTGNVVKRGVLPTDTASTYWYGVMLPAPTNYALPHRVENNIFVQTAETPVIPSNNMRWLRPTGTNAAPTVVRGNTFINRGTSQHGLVTNPNTASSLYGYRLENNHAHNMAGWTYPGSKLDNTVFATGNTVSSMTRNNDWRHLTGISMSPADYPSYTNYATAKIQSIRGHRAGPPILNDGYFEVGDIIFNNTPVAGGFMGWTCVVSGNPGTWKGFGAIEA